jgi:hypothetical protein
MVEQGGKKIESNAEEKSGDEIRGEPQEVGYCVQGFMPRKHGPSN